MSLVGMMYNSECMVSLSLRILLAANKREGLLCIYGNVIFMILIFPWEKVKIIN